MIVLDASAAVDFLVERAEPGTWVVERLAEVDSVHAPHLIDIEVAAALRKLVALGEITEDLGAQALTDLAEMRMARYPALALLDRIWELKNSLSAYDAAYVALAEALEIPLVTTDQRLARAGGHGAEVTAFPG